MSLNPLDSARRFYEKIGFLPVHPLLPFMAWEPWRRREFVVRVQARLDAENATPPNESTKEKGVSKMTPELEKYFRELDAIYEKYGCSVGRPSSAKKAASATSSKNILVSLKHLEKEGKGFGHTQLDHGNWSKGPGMHGGKVGGGLAGAVRRRLGDDIGVAAVQGGGGKLSTGSKSKQPWEMTEAEWEQHVKSRAGIQGLPKDAVAEYLQSQLMSGRHIAKVQTIEEQYRGNAYGIDISSPRTSTVREHTTYDESDENKRRPHKELYDSAVIDKDGKIIDKRYQSHSKAFPAVRDESKTSLFRGMQNSEFISAIKSGQFGSTGKMLMGSQAGTYFATNAHQASSYAGFFAPFQYGPTFEQPSYVVEIRRPGRARNTEQGGEVEVLGRISTSRIIRVLEIRVATERAGRFDLIPHETKYREGKELLQSGGSNGLNQRYVVREVPKGEWGNTFHKQQVQQAISEGKPVPPSVLADYPELAATSTKSLRILVRLYWNKI